jgi:flavin-dependent dehydrogenase
MHDLAIVGGGPAGATLARLSGKDHKVLLLERRDLLGSRGRAAVKSCGGLLDPDAQKVLASFRLGLPKAVTVGPQMFAVRTLDLDNGLERHYQRHYVNVDREGLDAWLLSLLPPSVELVVGATYLSHVESGDRVRIRFLKGGRVFEEEARALVGADGGGSRVRRLAFADSAWPRRYAAIQEWYECGPGFDYYGAIFDSRTTDFYSWTIPKDGAIILGSALPPGREAPARFAALKERLVGLGFPFGRLVRRDGAWLLRPLRQSQVLTGKGRVALVGEAAGFISPSSAEGISYAMRSALALATALAACRSGTGEGQSAREAEGGGWQSAYRRAAGGLLREISLKNLKSPFMYGPVLRGLVMRSGLLSIEVQP